MYTTLLHKTGFCVNWSGAFLPCSLRRVQHRNVWTSDTDAGDGDDDHDDDDLVTCSPASQASRPLFCPSFLRISLLSLHPGFVSVCLVPCACVWLAGVCEECDPHTLASR